jgi:hypothetical protein
METKQQKTKAIGEAQQTEKLYMENTLLRVSGALFCHDPKRAATRTEEIELGSGGNEKTIVIRPDPKLGQPGQLAHKIFIALLTSAARNGEDATASSCRGRCTKSTTLLSKHTSRRVTAARTKRYHH